MSIISQVPFLVWTVWKQKHCVGCGHNTSFHTLCTSSFISILNIWCYTPTVGVVK